MFESLLQVMVVKIVADYKNSSSVLRTQQAVQIIQRILYRHEVSASMR